MKKSLDLAQRLADAGYRQVIATPHWIPGTAFMPSPETVIEATAELNRNIKDAGIDLAAHPGMEIAIDSRIPDLLADRSIIGLAGKSHVLVETPFLIFPLGWEKIFSAVLSKGFNIILAHPERCAQLCEKKGLVDEIFNAGISMQVNWASFLGYHGDEAKHMAEHMASNGYIHCLATDSHDSVSRRPGHAEKAKGLVLKVVGEDNLRLLAYENPARILRGDPISPMSSSKPRGRKSNKRRWLHS